MSGSGLETSPILGVQSQVLNRRVHSEGQQAAEYNSQSQPEGMETRPEKHQRFLSFNSTEEQRYPVSSLDVDSYDTLCISDGRPISELFRDLDTNTSGTGPTKPGQITRSATQDPASRRRHGSHEQTSGDEIQVHHNLTGQMFT